MNNIQRQGVEHHLNNLLSFIHDDEKRQAIINDVIDDVCQHIDECADWESLGEYCNLTDIELAFDEVFGDIMENAKKGAKDAATDDFTATDDKSPDKSGKVAKIVYFEVATRVVVDKNEMPECEDEDAVNEAIRKLNSRDVSDIICWDNFVDITDDNECPYGTFEGEK